MKRKLSYIQTTQLIHIGFFISVMVVVLLIAFVKSIPDGLLHIVFCDVGQGDAIYIKLPDGKDVLVDGGPNDDVLLCLGNNMAFWDRTIEMVVMTHPQYDHFRGLIDVLSRYNVQSFVAPPVGNTTKSYQKLEDLVKLNNIRIFNAYQGDKIPFYPKGEKGKTDFIYFLSPQKNWVSSHIVEEDRTTVGYNNVLGAKTFYKDLNDFTLVFLVEYGKFDALFTGDAESKVLDRILDNFVISSRDIEVIKVPHHGAKKGLTDKIVKILHPDFAVISVGKNGYGHPAKETLQLLDTFHIPYKRTDQDGEIEIVSNGETWWIKEK